MSSSLKTLEPKLSATPPAAPAASAATPAVKKPVHPFALSWRFDRARGEFVVHAGARAGALAGAALALLAGAGLAFLFGLAFRAGAGGPPAQVADADAPVVSSEPAPTQWQSQPAPQAKSKPQAKASKSAKQSKSSSKQAAARGTKAAAGTTVAAKPRVDAQGRQAGLNYLILKSYPKQAEATSARELLARKGVTATVERNLPGWAGKGWYSLVGTTGFDMQRDRGAFDRHVKDLKALKLDPKPYRWRGAEVAAGE